MWWDWLFQRCQIRATEEKEILCWSAMIRGGTEHRRWFPVDGKGVGDHGKFIDFPLFFGGLDLVHAIGTESLVASAPAPDP